MRRADSISPRRLRFGAESWSCLPHAKRGIQCVEQCRVAERLEQALHGTVRRADAVGAVLSAAGSDEDGRNVLPPTCQFRAAARGRTCPAWRCRESDSRVWLTKLGREERFRRRESLRGKAELPQQVGKDSRTDSSSSTIDTSERVADHGILTLASRHVRSPLEMEAVTCHSADAIASRDTE